MFPHPFYHQPQHSTVLCEVLILECVRLGGNICNNTFSTTHFDITSNTNEPEEVPNDDSLESRSFSLSLSLSASPHLLSLSESLVSLLFTRTPPRKRNVGCNAPSAFHLSIEAQHSRKFAEVSTAGSRPHCGIQYHTSPDSLALFPQCLYCCTNTHINRLCES